MSQEEVRLLANEIQQLIQQCQIAKTNKAKDARYKMDKLAQKLNYYDGYAESQQEQERLRNYRKQFGQIKLIGISNNKKQALGIVDQSREEVKDIIKVMKNDITHTNTIGERIIAQLHHQMEELDKITEENKGISYQLKRIKSSLNTLLRGIMTDKCTCALIILLILGIIAVLVIYFIRKNKQ